MRLSAAAMQDPEYVKEAFAGIADRYVVTNHVLSLGIDILWRRRVAKMVHKMSPCRILDVATGSGDMALEMERVCTGAEITGTDFCAPMLEQANRRGLKNTVLADALNLPFEDGEFCALTVCFGLRNMQDWEKALREMGRVLKPGGELFILDFSLPRIKLMRGIYRLYLHTLLPAIAGMITGRREAYRYLGSSIESFPSGMEMCDLIESVGFFKIRQRPLFPGVATIYSAIR
ncbi:MAG: ubiquinone/menaquinone biosynthesis methyltransferase [Verrucomicrobiales bacterium]|nr:ubiquinone/menaquinone biosynthesis methyltransferase [Verrucomicrobiales bacterium]